MRFVDLMAAAALALALAGCGGGTTTETTITGGGLGGGSVAVAAVDTPTGPNTTEVVVDAGPPGAFALGAANVPYVTVTVCAPGSTTQCATIDHVFLDTGSIGLRVFKSKLGSVSLSPVMVPADAASATPAGEAAECYPFVLGAVWGDLRSADVRIAQELAPAIPIQVIDDDPTPARPAPADCVSSANGGLLDTVASLQANGILGVGMLAYDCGSQCASGTPIGGYTLYYSCGSNCVPGALPSPLQMQNPVAHFDVDNNGTIITLPSLPDLGAGTARGRLVFGIATQANNQIAQTATVHFVDNNPANSTYLYLTTTVGGQTYPDSYIDSGSNAFFFDDAAVPKGCQSSSGSTGGWYCPASALTRSATLAGIASNGVADPGSSVAFKVASADALFSSSSLAFNDLAGSAGQGTSTFVWGLPFFYGRTVYTSIWGQPLSTNGPWNAF